MNLYTKLQQRAADNKPIRIGLIGAVELVADKDTGAPFDPVGRMGPALAKAA